MKYTFSLLLILSIVTVSCQTAKIAGRTGGPINGYVTFNAIAFTFDDKGVEIEISLMPHYKSGRKRTDPDQIDPDVWGKGEIINRIEAELKDISEKTGFTYQQTSNDVENIGRKFHVGSYANVNILFQNLAARLRDFSSDSAAAMLPVLTAKFARGSKHNEMLFSYSPGMFEKRAVISFKSIDGNITSYSDNIPSARIHSIATRFLEYVVRPSVMDSLTLGRTNLLRLTYSKKPIPRPAWYSVSNIRKIFSSDSEQRPVKDGEKALSSKTDLKVDAEDANNKISNLWVRMNDTVKWFIEIALPILAFFGIVNFNALLSFFRKLFFRGGSRNSAYKKSYSA